MIDKKETEILKIIDKNARTPINKIARLTKLSKETVQYRIAKLEKNHFITGYHAIINGFRLGNKVFKLLLKFNEYIENDLSNWLKKRKEVIWIGSCEGKWNLMITFQTKEIYEAIEFLEDFSKIFKKKIQEKEILISYEVRIFNNKFLLDKDPYEHILKQEKETYNVDGKDKKIILELSKNARISAVELSKKVKLTAEGVASRIKKLIKNKIIVVFKTSLNLEKLGYQYVHIFISIKDFDKIQELINYYKSHKYCVSLLRHQGFYDLHLEMVFQKNSELKQIINEFKSNFGKSISNYETEIIYNEEHFIPLPS